MRSIKHTSNVEIVETAIVNNETKITKEEIINFNEQIKYDEKFNGEITLKDIENYFISIKGK